MKKELIKCDSCKEEITKGGYYNFVHQNLYGWAVFYKPHWDGIASEFQVCVPCVEKKLKVKV